MMQLQGEYEYKVIYYTDEQGLDNIIENVRQLHSCMRNQDTLIAVLAATRNALAKAEELNAAKDTIIENRQKQLIVADEKNEMLQEDNEKLKKKSTLWKIIAGAAAVVGYVLGAQ